MMGDGGMAAWHGIAWHVGGKKRRRGVYWKELERR